MAGRAHVLGVDVDRLDMPATVERCRELVLAGGPSRHVCVNAAKLVALQRDGRLREIVRDADVVSADGQAVVWATRLLRRPVPARVAGIDLMDELLELAERERWRVYFLGARDDVLRRALDGVRARYPGLAIVGSRDGYFAEDEEADVCADIRAARPHLLFVAMSSPRKEYWLGQYADELGVPFSMGIGGALDIEAGLVRRAPRWVQRAGFEWAYRLSQDPRRLFGRYVVGNTRFALLVAGALLRREPREEAA